MRSRITSAWTILTYASSDGRGGRRAAIGGRFVPCRPPAVEFSASPCSKGICRGSLGHKQGKELVEPHQTQRPAHSGHVRCFHMCGCMRTGLERTPCLESMLKNERNTSPSLERAPMREGCWVGSVRVLDVWSKLCQLEQGFLGGAPVRETSVRRRRVSRLASGTTLKAVCTEHVKRQAQEVYQQQDDRGRMRRASRVFWDKLHARSLGVRRVDLRPRRGHLHRLVDPSAEVGMSGARAEEE